MEIGIVRNACCEYKCRLRSTYMSQSNSKRLSISFINVRNKDFGEKLSSNGSSKWLSKYSHFLFRIFRQPKIEYEHGSLEFTRDIEKLLESENIRKAIFMRITLQMMIYRVSFTKTIGDSLSLSMWQQVHWCCSFFFGRGGYTGAAL